MNPTFRAPPGVPLRVDLGSGPRPTDGHLGLDLFMAPAEPGLHLGVLYFRLGTDEPWPFDDESVESLYSSHFIEHIPARDVGGKDALARFFEEAWRVAAPGASFRLRWPSFIDERTGQWLQSAFYDPTHRRFIPPQQLLYFSVSGRQRLNVTQYGFRCNWVLESIGQRPLCEDESVLEYDALLRKHPL